MILTDKKIKAAVASGEIEIDPFDERQIQPASYDLRVGAQGISTTSNALLDIQKWGFFEAAPR